MWRETLKSRVDAHLQRKPSLRMVVSPDFDGCVSAVILAEYAKKQFSIPSEIIGAYDSEKITVTNSSITENEVFDSLWVDLDIQFPKVTHNIAHVGQHLLLTKINNDSFNPNNFFGIKKITDKYPFSTAFFLFYGLFEEAEFSVFTDSRSLAISCLFHCDVSFMLVREYVPNCKRWVGRLFGGAIPQSVEYLVCGKYERNNSESHLLMFNKLQRALGKRIQQVGEANDIWSYVNDKTSVKGESADKTFENICAVTNCVKNLFNVESRIECDYVDAKVIWEGERMYPVKGEEKLDKAVSHAWINGQTVSVTYEYVR